jgi:hypothetical protein
VADPTGDRWIVRFYGVPGQDIAATTTTTTTTAPAAPTASSVISSGTSVTIEIGDFSQQVTVAKQSVRFGFKSTGTTPGIFRLLMDPVKFVHRIETNILSVDDTSIPAAITTKDSTVFPLRMSVTGFTGDSGRVIAPNRSRWQQQ